MKKTPLVFSTLMALATMGCFKSMDTMEDNFNFNIDKQLSVIHSATGVSVLIKDTLRMWEAGAIFMRNRSSIRSLEIRSLSCTVTDIQGIIPQMLTGTLNIGDTEGKTIVPIATLENVSTASMMSQMHQMNMYGDGKNMMMDMMMRGSDMMMYFNCTGQDSMHFSMRFDFEMNAECEAMDMMN